MDKYNSAPGSQSQSMYPKGRRVLEQLDNVGPCAKHSAKWIKQHVAHKEALYCSVPALPLMLSGPWRQLPR